MTKEIDETVDLSTTVKLTLERYFRHLNGEKTTSIYDMVIRSVEHPMLLCVMAEANNNQVIAAKLLGISRGTLRKKLNEYNIEVR